MSNVLKLLSFIINQQTGPERPMKPILSTQEHRYRSVKYKINRDISMSIHETSVDKKLFLPSTAKNSLFKSRRNGNKFSVSHITDFRNSANNCESPQDQKLRRTTYMDTFHMMLNMERNRHNAKQKDREQQEIQEKQKLSSVEIGTKLSRVQLPVLNELDSHFTVLDNVNLPIGYINEEIGRVKEEIVAELVNVKKIAHSLKEIQKKTNKFIEELEEQGKKGFEKLRNLLKSNRVNQQEQILKNKSALQKARDYLPEFYNSLDKSKQDLRALQDTIFKGGPFQLEQGKQFELISSKYF